MLVKLVLREYSSIVRHVEKPLHTASASVVNTRGMLLRLEGFLCGVVRSRSRAAALKAFLVWRPQARALTRKMVFLFGRRFSGLGFLQGPHVGIDLLRIARVLYK